MIAKYYGVNRVNEYGINRVNKQKNWVCVGVITVEDGENTCRSEAEAAFAQLGVDCTFVDLAVITRQKNYIGESEDCQYFTLTAAELEYYHKLRRVSAYKAMEKTLREALERVDYDPEFQKFVAENWDKAK